MRDAVKEQYGSELTQNKNWDELQARYAECRNLLLMHLGVGNILQNPEITGELSQGEAKTLINNIQILTRDLDARATELATIYGTHSDKIGGCDENTIMLSFEIMEKYTQWLSLVEAVVQPTLAHILEITGEVEKRVLAKQAATDPNVITDVEVIEGTPSSQQSAVIADGIAAADHTNPKSE